MAFKGSAKVKRGVTFTRRRQASRRSNEQPQQDGSSSEADQHKQEFVGRPGPLTAASITGSPSPKTYVHTDTPRPASNLTYLLSPHFLQAGRSTVRRPPTHTCPSTPIRASTAAVPTTPLLTNNDLPIASKNRPCQPTSLITGNDPPSSPARKSPLSPRIQWLITLFGGKRRSSTSTIPAKGTSRQQRERRSESLSSIYEAHSPPHASCNVLASRTGARADGGGVLEASAPVPVSRPAPPPPHLLPSESSGESLPPSLVLQQHVDIKSAPTHPLFGNAMVVKDCYSPAVVQRGFDVPGQKGEGSDSGSSGSESRKKEKESVLDRKGDTWYGFMQTEHEKMFQKKKDVGMGGASATLK